MTDLYVQKPKHTEQEEQHYTELALRLIDLVDANDPRHRRRQDRGLSRPRRPRSGIGC